MNATLSMAAAVGSAVAAWGAAAFARQQASAAKAQNSLSFVTNLVQEWDSDAIVRQRTAAARHLLAGEGVNSLPVFRVMQRFEQVGILLERKALDPLVAWSQLSTPILHYHAACRPVIEAYRRENPQAWTSFDYVARAMSKIERERHGSDHTLASNEVEDFLEREVLPVGAEQLNG